jgi:hypothetical protein
MPYVELITIDPALATAGSYVFRANSIQDPNQTGVGHQPLGRDQFLPFFDHYTVIKSTISAHFVSRNTNSGTGSAMCGIALFDNLTTIGNPETIMEQPNSHYTIMTNSGAGGSAKVRASFNSKKFFGLQSVKDNRNVVGANQEFNPSDGAYFHVYAAPTVNSDDVSGLAVIVKIVYTVLLTERKSLTSS